jgi:hypothetical protein
MHDGLESIGNGAFSFCTNLVSIVIPDSVSTIGDSCFSYCFSLENVKLPSSLHSLGALAFSLCGQLSYMLIPESVQETWARLLNGCSNLKRVVVPDGIYNQKDRWNAPEGCEIVKWSEIGGKRTADGVPYIWFFEYPSLLESANGDYEVASTNPAANGENLVWQCHVAGLDPTSATNRFLTEIVFDTKGVPIIKWSPDLGSSREYDIEGKVSLSDDWGPTNTYSRFFRVLVRLPE